MTSEERQAEVVAVFHAKVKAASGGKGTVVALVLGKNGQGALLGTTCLVKYGHIADASVYGRFLRAQQLAEKLGGKIPVISGADACRAYLSEHSIKGIEPADIIEDANPGSLGKSAVDASDNFRK